MRQKNRAEISGISETPAKRQPWAKNYSVPRFERLTYKLGSGPISFIHSAEVIYLIG